MTLKETVVRITAEAQSAEARRKQEEEDAAIVAAQLLRDSAAAWAKAKMVEVEEEIIKAAREGKNKVIFGVGQFEECVSERTHLRSDALVTLLRSEDFDAEITYTRTEPCGSDSMFDHTVTSTSVDVWW